MRIDILTIFPEYFSGVLSTSLLGKAVGRGTLDVRLHQLRDYTTDRHRTIDDAPYGGGHGMVMKIAPLVTALEAISPPGAHRVLLSARGYRFTQKVAHRLASLPSLVLLCGRYEGVDERIGSFVDEQLCIGDYVLSGGEAAAAVLIDAVSRLVPGVIGNESSLTEESFSTGLLEYPQYTRPDVFRDLPVPEVLLSGDHAAVARWRRTQAEAATAERRPDLLAPASDRPPAAPPGLEESPVKSSLYLALVHHPVLDRQGHVVTTSITNMDVHDIARTGRTFGVRRFYVVHPIPGLRSLAERIVEHWRSGYGSRYNPSRHEALGRVEVEPDLDHAIAAVEQDSGRMPRLVATTARERPGAMRYVDLARHLATGEDSWLLLFGTGYGMSDEVFDRCEAHLEPVRGVDGYNHLSVRSAAAVILDRLTRSS